MYNEFSIFQSSVTYETVQELAMTCRCDDKLHDGVVTLLNKIAAAFYNACQCWPMLETRVQIVVIFIILRHLTFKC